MSAPARRSHLHVVPAAPGPRQDRPSDEAIVEGLRCHDPKVAGVLYDRVAPAIDRALYRIFGRREVDHDDLVQSTFEQIIVTIEKRRYAGACSLPTWASTIATNVGLNALRSRRRERRVLDRGEASAEEPRSQRVEGEDRAFAKLAIERVRVELAAMKPDRAEAVFLHDVLGHELAEIALILDISVAAAQSRLVRGRKELMERLSDIAQRTS